MKIKNILKSIFLILTATIIFSGCSKNSQKPSASDKNRQNQTKIATKIKSLDEETKAYIEGKTLAVILGHSYNDEQTVSHFKQLINEKFGLKTEDGNGLVSVLVYPDDFMVAGKIRISSLYSKLEDTPLAGIITFGAPEGLCNALAKLEDLSEKRSYPVFSFFQQDDSLGSESTADFVLDYVPPAENLEQEQSSVIPDFDMDSLLINSISEMLAIKTDILAEKELLKTVQKIVGKQKTVINFSDYETGLKSVNHFVFE
jgi:hypothetical protein